MATGTPLRCWYVLINHNRLWKINQLGLYHTHTRMLNYSSHDFVLVLSIFIDFFLMPFVQLFILNYNTIVLLELVDYLVRLVFFLVGEIKVLSFDILDCLVSVVRTFLLSLQFLLQHLESFTFFNRYINLLTF